MMPDNLPRHAPLDRRIPFNRARAEQIMDEEGVDGLVACNPVNVFYCTNFVSYRIRMGAQPAASYAVVARDATRPTGLVVVTTDLWELASGERDYPELVVPYSGMANWQEVAAGGVFDVEPAAVGATAWSHDPSAYTAREQRWMDHDREFRGRSAPGPEWGLVRVIRELGLDQSTLAVDDPKVARALGATGLRGVRCLDGDNIFRRIRVVKSEVEIGHMRTIARANQAAAAATMSQLAAGATQADITRLFMVEAAKQGARAVWIAAGTPAGLASPELAAGQVLMIDAVSEINHYHGDFGRTLTLGEPTAAVKARTRMMQNAWDAVFEALRPGRKYSELRRIGTDAMKKSGLSGIMAKVGPHSVGLQHTDEPYVRGLPYAVKDDLVLEENMTMTVDFPSLAPGLGHAHLEDLVRITKDGAEPLGWRDGALISV